MATTVRDVMTPNVETATSSQMRHDAAQKMRTGDFGSIPVVDDGQLVAVLTDRDIVVRAVTEGLDPTTVQVGQVASPDPVTIAPEQELDDALEIMAHYQVRRLPVVELGVLVGVLSQADIALEAREKKVGEVVQEISQPAPEPPAGPGSAQPPPGARGASRLQAAAPSPDAPSAPRSFSIAAVSSSCMPPFASATVWATSSTSAL